LSDPQLNQPYSFFCFGRLRGYNAVVGQIFDFPIDWRCRRYNAGALRCEYVIGYRYRYDWYFRQYH